jgi:hypothetical protein
MLILLLFCSSRKYVVNEQKRRQQKKKNALQTLYLCVIGETAFQRCFSQIDFEYYFSERNL